MEIKHLLVKVKPTEHKENIIMSKPKFANISLIIEPSVISWVRLMEYDCRIIGCACGIWPGAGRSGVLILESAGESFMLLAILTGGSTGCWNCFTK
jgi:hypothetical protein